MMSRVLAVANVLRSNKFKIVKTTEVGEGADSGHEGLVELENQVFVRVNEADYEVIRVTEGDMTAGKGLTSGSLTTPFAVMVEARRLLKEVRHDG